MSASKYWVFTINNYPNPDIPVGWVDEATYCVWQEEVGAEGTPHLQGYIALKKPSRLSALKKLPGGDKAHWEPRKGNHEQAKAYCTKEDTRKGETEAYTYGVEPVSHQGERTDIAHFVDLVKEGKGEADLLEAHPHLIARHPGFFNNVRRILKVPEVVREWPTFTTVYWGASGSGKSRRALWEAQQAYDGVWEMPRPKTKDTNPWFDGYTGQEAIIINDYYGWTTRDFMYRLCDRYACPVEIKGHMVQALPKHIYITSNSHPQTWWPNLGLGAMERRLQAPLGEIVCMNEPWAPPGEQPEPLPEGPQLGLHYPGGGATSANYTPGLPDTPPPAAEGVQTILHSGPWPGGARRPYIGSSKGKAPAKRLRSEAPECKNYVAIDQCYGPGN